jgi:hypothetical protein
MRYARIVDNAVAELRDFAIQPDPNPLKGLDWRPCPVVPRPVYDPATHVCTGPTYTIQADQVVEGWTVRAKTAEEIAAATEVAKEAAAREAEAIKQLFQAAFRINNDVRTLKGQNTWTRQEFRQWVKDL